MRRAVPIQGIRAGRDSFPRAGRGAESMGLASAHTAGPVDVADNQPKEAAEVAAPVPTPCICRTGNTRFGRRCPQGSETGQPQAPVGAHF